MDKHKDVINERLEELGTGWRVSTIEPDEFGSWHAVYLHRMIAICRRCNKRHDKCGGWAWNCPEHGRGSKFTERRDIVIPPDVWTMNSSAEMLALIEWLVTTDPTPRSVA